MEVLRYEWAKFRALSELYSQWLREKKIDRNSDAALNFALELGLIAEHTQGVDVKTHLQNWDKYDTDLFLPARSTAPFRKAEASWKELDDYIYNAIQYLPQNLQEEALAEMKKIDRVEAPSFTKESESGLFYSLAGIGFEKRCVEDRRAVLPDV